MPEQGCCSPRGGTRGRAGFPSGTVVLGALNQAGMQDWAFPSCGSSLGLGRGGGISSPGPLFQLRLAQRREGSRTCPYGSCRIVTVSCPDLTHTHLAEWGSLTRVGDPAPREVVDSGLRLLESPPVGGGGSARGPHLGAGEMGLEMMLKLGPALGGRCGAQRRLVWKGVCVMSMARAPSPRESSCRRGWGAE